MAQVQLAVYDLSHGMARGLSAQFLGPNHAIEIIPHTAIVVFGKEYFFGGGIQAVPPQQFRNARNMHPIQTLTLGTTTVSQADFDNWCFQQMQSGQYAMEAYDLLHRNCNHFSHDAALQGLRLTNGVPAWILQVPQRFLSSPMGQMIRPMLEQMQITGTTAPVGGTTGGSTTTFAPTVTSATNTNTATSTTNTSTTPPAPVPSTDVNPWANLPAQPKPTTNTSTTSTTTTSSTTTTTTTSTTTTITTPILDNKYTKPFLSNDSKSVPMCIAKLVAAIENKEQKRVLEQLGRALVQQTPAVLDDALATSSLGILLGLLQKDGTSSTILTFTLMIIRLVVLVARIVEQPSSSSRGGDVQPTLEWIAMQLVSLPPPDVDHETLLRISSSVPAKSMAWCVWSNAMAVHGIVEWMTMKSQEATLESLTECAIRDLQHARVEMRQAASCFLYNYYTTVVVVGVTSIQKQLDDSSSTTTTTPNELDDATVSLLCAMLEGVDSESDATTQLRRLLVVGRILKKHVHKAAAKNLIRDLGFVETLQLMANTSSTSTSTQAGQVAGELVELVNSVSP
jgi:hypothetical protein